MRGERQSVPGAEGAGRGLVVTAPDVLRQNMVSRRPLTSVSWSGCLSAASEQGWGVTYRLGPELVVPGLRTGLSVKGGNCYTACPNAREKGIFNSGEWDSCPSAHKRCFCPTV